MIKSSEPEKREAIELWLQKNPDKILTDCPKGETVKIKSGKVVPLGNILSTERRIYNSMRRGKHFGRSKDLTEEQIAWRTEHGMNWESLSKKQDDTIYRKAAKLWLKQNPGLMLAECSRNEVVEIELGKVIHLGSRLHTMRQIYNAMQRGEHFQKNLDLTEEQIKWWTELGMNWNLQNENGKNFKKKQAIIGQDYTINETTSIAIILNEFQIDFDIFAKYMREIKQENLIYEKRYNYKVMSIALKLHNIYEKDTLEQLIEKAKKTYEQQLSQKTASWIYEKYGSSIRSILSTIEVNGRNILINMSTNTICLEYAIAHEIFRTQICKKEYKRLESIYNLIIENINIQMKTQTSQKDIFSELQKTIENYSLSAKESEAIYTALLKYLETIRQYQIIDVGLEQKQEEKIKKIKEYDLDYLEIEDSYLVALLFTNKKPIRQNTKLYQRRQLLQQYIADWDCYTEKEIEEEKTKKLLTMKEIQYISMTKTKINDMQQKVKKYLG